MQHCVRTYAQSIANGRCVIFSLKDEATEDRATLEFSITLEGLKFNQLKAKHNARATEKIITTVISFCEKSKIASISDFHKNTGDLFAEKTGEVSHFYGEPENNLF